MKLNSITENCVESMVSKSDVVADIMAQSASQGKVGSYLASVSSVSCDGRAGPELNYVGDCKH